MTGTYLNTITRRLCWGLSASRMRGVEGLLSPSTCGTARPRMTRLKRIWALRFLWLKDRRERRGSMTVYAYLCVPRNQGTPVEEDRTKNQQLLTSLRVQILAGNCRRHSLYHFLLVQCCQWHIVSASDVDECNPCEIVRRIHICGDLRTRTMNRTAWPLQRYPVFVWHCLRERVMNAKTGQQMHHHQRDHPDLWETYVASVVLHLKYLKGFCMITVPVWTNVDCFVIVKPHCF